MSAESLLFTVVLAAASLVAWIATYAVHSTIILGGVWLLLRSRLRPDDPRARELLWKGALVGAVATTTLHAFGVVAPSLDPLDVSGVVELRRWNDMRVIPAPRELLGTRDVAVFGARLPDPAALLRLVPIVLLGTWALYATVVVVRVVVGALRTRALLGPRHDAHVADFASLARAMGVRRPVRLTRSDRVASPVALGRAEICLPTRALAELTPDEQRSVLAHELAHLRRRDPWWLLAAATLESLFFFQPLNRVARMHLQDEAELLADDLAVRQTGAGLTLARCLARVAEWTQGERAPRPLAPTLLAPALVESRRTIVDRVRRLLDDDRAVAPPSPRRTVRRVVAASALPVAALLVAPSFTGGEVRAWGTPAFHWEGEVAAGERIEIDGAMGSVRAEPTGGSTVVVNATRHGRPTTPDITFQVVRHAGGVTVCVVYPVPAGHAPNDCRPGVRGPAYNTPANDVEVEFLVRVPAGVGFAARTATGDVTTGLLSGPVRVHSASGAVDVSTSSYASASSGSGDVRVRMGRTAWSDTLRVETASGNLTVELPGDASTDVVARSRAGGVRSDFSAVTGPHLGFWRRLALRGSLGEHAAGTLGGGGRTLLLSSTAGGITLRRTR